MKFINTFSPKKAQINGYKAFNYIKPLYKLESVEIEKLSSNARKQKFYKKIDKFNKHLNILTPQELSIKLSKASLKVRNRDLIEKNIELKTLEKKELKTVQSKHYPSSLREWDNSIFTYNSRSLDLIPSTTNKAFSIIRDFFNYFNGSLEKKMRSKRLLKRLKRLSSHRIYLSKGIFSHTNNKVLVNLYVFNRQKYNYLSKLKNIYLTKLCAGTSQKKRQIDFLNELKSIYSKGLNNLKIVNRHKYSLLRALNTLDNKKNYKLSTFKSVSLYTLSFYKKLFKLSVRKLRFYFLYKQLLYLNKSKLNYTYLRFLKKHLENLYNKNVEFNFINLKRFYLNSDILCEAVKLKLTRNKKKMRKIFNKLTNKVKIYKKKIFLGFSKAKKDELLLKRIKGKAIKEVYDKNLETFVFNNLKYKHITGFRLETKGRLSRRFTASRSVSKFKYKGNLLNLDSSFRGISSVILKGNLQSNLQYTKLKSKTRIGSFGIKGWVSAN